MKKTLLISILISIVLYFLTYLVRVFVSWKFFNPFDWIIAIPTYTPDVRGIILMFYAMYQIILLFAVHQSRKDIKERKEKAK